MKFLNNSMFHNNRPIKYPLICFLFVFVFNASALAGSNIRECYWSNTVCINNASNEDIELALNAVKKAYDFFAGLGFIEKYNIELFFEKAVMVEIGNGNFIRIYGKLGKEGNIYLTDWNEPWLTEQNAYGLEMSKDFYESLIIHEVAHFIAEKIAGRKIENTLSEYSAYIVQLSQMQPTIRQTILSRCPLSGFKTEEIQLDIMLFDPTIFGVKSYLHFKQSEGQYLKEILSGAVKEPADLAYWHFH